MEREKRAYEKPNLVEYGTVSELTKVLGKTFLTDAAFTGSMAMMGGGRP